MHSKPSDKNLPFTFRQVLLFSLPALIVGLALRLFLTVNAPYGFVISDTREFHDLDITSLDDLGNPFKVQSRTYLPRLLYAAPLFMGKPMLPFIAVVQHLFGLGMIFAGGLLCALWTKRWKWWIIPFTVLLAVNPTLLWYEHMALPDSTAVAVAMVVAAFGGLYYWKPSRVHLGGLCVGLILLASARQEGFLFLPFGVLVLVLRHYGELKQHAKSLGVIVGACLLAFFSSRTSQGGQMLLTSTIHMAPDRLWTQPGFSQEAVALREHFKPQWPCYPANHNKTRKVITKEVNEYLQSRMPGQRVDKLNNSFCKTVGMEIALRNFWRMPSMAFHKFLATRWEAPSPRFDARWLHEKHANIIFGAPNEEPPKDWAYQKAYFGREFASRQEFSAWLLQAYPVEKLAPLAAFQSWFVKHTADWAPATKDIQGQRLPGLPYIYLLGFLGLLAAASHGGPTKVYRFLWIGMVLAQAFAVFGAASLRSRYRLLYEPWWYLGLFCLLDIALVVILNLWAKRSQKTPAPLGSQAAGKAEGITAGQTRG